jgi:hypothetical protein
MLNKSTKSTQASYRFGFKKKTGNMHDKAAKSTLATTSGWGKKQAPK